MWVWISTSVYRVYVHMYVWLRDGSSCSSEWLVGWCVVQWTPRLFTHAIAFQVCLFMCPDLGTTLRLAQLIRTFSLSTTTTITTTTARQCLHAFYSRASHTCIPRDIATILSVTWYQLLTPLVDNQINISVDFIPWQEVLDSLCVTTGRLYTKIDFAKWLANTKVILSRNSSSSSNY